MAKIENIEEKRKGDRLTAQLAMAAAKQPETDGDCLTPEQLADVASNHCTPEERKAALAHLAGCRACYNAWVGVSLSLLAMESGLERGKKPLLSLRNMGYLGSAVAVAASVVVFFHLQGDLVRQGPAPSRETTVERLQPPSPQQPEAGLQEERVRGSAEKEKKVESPARRLSPAQVPGEARQESVPATAGRGPAAADSDRAPGGGQADKTMRAAGWLASMGSFCREKRYLQEPGQWSLLRERGRSALQQGADRQLQEKITAVLAVMTADAGQPQMAAQCGAILSLLAAERQKE